MPRIGVVLAGGMSKGAYQIGCLKAIERYFGKKAIQYISASSIGALSAYAFSTGKLQLLTEEWKSIDIQHNGRFFPRYSGNPILLKKIRELVKNEDQLNTNMYVTIWNYTDKKAEYISFRHLSPKERRDYLCASIAIPIFGKGVKLNDKLLFDGAFLDNIPVYPLLEKKLDYIFCVYFDGCNYFFESTPFDNKVIKLFDFPAKGKWDNFTYDPERVDEMISFAENYTAERIQRIFASNDSEAILEEIQRQNKESKSKKRLTADVFLTNINKMTIRLSKKEIL